jgi:hypothetical protein
MEPQSYITDPEATEVEWPESPDTDNSETEENTTNVGSTEESKHDVAATGEIEGPQLHKKSSKDFQTQSGNAAFVFGFVATVAVAVLCHEYLVPTIANQVMKEEEVSKYLPKVNMSDDLVGAKNMNPQIQQAVDMAQHLMRLDSIKSDDMQPLNAQVQSLDEKMQRMMHESWKMNDTVNEILQQNNNLVRLNGMLKEDRVRSDAKMQKMIYEYQQMNDTVYTVLQQNVDLVKLNSKLQMENDAKYQPGNIWNRVAGAALSVGSVVAFNWLRPSLSAVAVAQAQNLVLGQDPTSSSAAMVHWAREGLQQLIGLDSRMVLAKLTQSAYHAVQLSQENVLLNQQIDQTYEWLCQLNVRNQELNQLVSGLEKVKQDLEKTNQYLNDRNMALESDVRWKENQDPDVECVEIA